MGKFAIYVSNPRHKLYPAGVCRDGAQLETTLVQALLEFFERMQCVWFYEPLDIPLQLAKISTDIQQVVYRQFEFLQDIGALPDALKGLHKDRIASVCREVSDVAQALGKVPWYGIDFASKRRVSSVSYGELLRRLQQACIQHGPSRWGDSAIAATLSAILTPILDGRDIFLRDRCTTPGAISRYFRPRT